MPAPRHSLVHVGNSTAVDQRRARVELAAAYRIAALEGLDDGIWNHFSTMVPGTSDRFLIKPHGLLFSEVTASNLIVVDLDGNLIEGNGAWEPTAFFIHSRIHKALPHASCVFHTHMPYATALACCDDDALLPVTQNTMRFHGRVGYFREFGGLALSHDEGDRMAAAIDGNDVLLMSNHGVIVTGRSIAEAVYDLHYLEVAARDQVLALQAACGRGLRLVAPETVALTTRQLNRNRSQDAAVYLAAMTRVLDAQGSGYRD